MKEDTPTKARRAESESDTQTEDQFHALEVVIKALQPLDAETRMRILHSVATFLGGTASPTSPESSSLLGEQVPTSYPSFSSDTSLSPKEFLLQKHPRTDVERVACLAYYLTHYRGTPQFKTLDLSKLNTEAAQPKFSNAANSVANAVKRRYLVPAAKGYRQISASGEKFVEALPDREAARQAMAPVRPRRRTKRPRPQASVRAG
jgi:hypothetical protein